MVVAILAVESLAPVGDPHCLSYLARECILAVFYDPDVEFWLAFSLMMD